MDLSYEVIASEPVGPGRTRVTVETKLNAVINGYGGGKLIFVVDNDRIQEEIEERIAWKFSDSPVPKRHKVEGLRGKLDKIQSLVDAANEKKEVTRVERERFEAEEFLRHSAAEAERLRVEEQEAERIRQAEEARLAAEAAEAERLRLEANQPSGVEEPVVEQPPIEELPPGPDLGEEAEPVDLGEPAAPVIEEEFVPGDLGEEAAPEPKD